MNTAADSRPLIGFIIPLISREVAADWDLVSRLCRRTLGSLLNQTSSRWVAVVVGSEPPTYWPDDARVHFVRAGLPVPTSVDGRYLDQKLKVKLGMIALRQFDPVFAMRLDADDLLTNKLVAMLAESPPAFGWYMADGYVFEEGSTKVIYHWRIDGRCASTFVVRLHRGDLPDGMDTADEDYLVDLWEHLRLKDTMRQLNRPLDRFPVPGVVYVVGNVGSIMGHTLKDWKSWKQRLWKLLYTRTASPDLRKEFGIISLQQCGEA